MSSESRIIIVDDDELVLRSTLAALEDWAARRRVHLQPCGSGAEALTMVEADPQLVSVVLSDLRMPGMKGNELLRRIAERYPEIVTVLVTGYADMSDIADAVQAGITSFVLKPWRLEYLTRELDKALHYRALRRENRRFLAATQEDLRWGGELQRALLRLDLPGSGGATYTLSSIPLHESQCAGDYHDVVALGDERTMFMVGDVAGHGVRAAFMTFFLRAAIRQGYLVGTSDPSPAGLLDWLNRLVCQELASLPSVLITLAVCMIRGTPPVLTYASAGHLPVYRVRGAEARALKAPGMGLGFDRDALYAEESCDLAPGDRVVLHTDGLRELGPSVRVEDQDFAAALVRWADSADYHASLLADIRSRSADGVLADDATLLTARIGG